MAWALVGTIGTATQGSAGGDVTPAFGASENRTKGNLLIAFVSVTKSATLPATPVGWAIAASASANSTAAAIYFRSASGADSAPSFVHPDGVALIAAQLAEYSGVLSTAVDRSGTNTGTGTSITATNGGADAALSELMTIASGDTRSVNRAPNDIITSNHITSVTAAGNNNGVSNQTHYSFAYGTTNSTASADTSVMTPSITTSVTGLAIVNAVWKLGVGSPASSFSSDAVIKKAQSGSLTADAVIFKAIPGSFTANADIKKTVSGSLAANAVVKTTVSAAEGVVPSGAWSSQDIGDQQFWGEMVYANGYYVSAVQGFSPGHIVYATDPTGTWTQVDVSRQCQTVGWDGTYFYAVGGDPSGSQIFRATNPAGPWTDVSPSDASVNNLYSFAYAPGVGYMATGSTSSTPGLYWSTDGSTWTHLSHNLGSIGSAKHITYGNGYWAIPFGLTNKLWYTTDPVGGVWTQNTGPTASELYYLNGYWIAASTYRASDPTGAFTTISGGITPGSNTSGWDKRLAYHNSVWVCVGDATSFKTHPGSSPDGTWTSQTGNGTSGGVAYGGGYWVTGGGFKNLANGLVRYNSALGGGLPFDAKIITTSSSSFTANSVISKTISGSIAADAKIASAGFTGSFTANSDIFKIISGSITGNSKLVKKQNGKVIQDLTNSIWYDQTGGTIDIFQSIDEETPDDADYIRTDDNPSGATYEGNVEAKEDPNTNAGHIVSVRHLKTGGRTATLDVTLYQSSGDIATFQVLPTQDVAVTTAYTLSPSEADAIVDYTKLKIRFRGATTGGGSQTRVRVTWLDFEVPGPASDTHVLGFLPRGVIFKTLSGSFSGNAVVLRSASGSFSANATIPTTVPGSITANAVIFKSASGSLTANADVMRSQSGSFSENSTILAARSGSVATDAVIKAIRSGSLNVDAVVRRAATGSLTANADVMRSQSGSFGANAVVRTTGSASLSADAVVLVARSGSFSADATIPTTVSRTLTAQAAITGTTKYFSEPFIRDVSHVIAPSSTSISLTLPTMISGDVLMIVLQNIGGTAVGPAITGYSRGFSTGPPGTTAYARNVDGSEGSTFSLSGLTSGDWVASAASMGVDSELFGSVSISASGGTTSIGSGATGTRTVGQSGSIAKIVGFILPSASKITLSGGQQTVSTPYNGKSAYPEVYDSGYTFAWWREGWPQVSLGTSAIVFDVATSAATISSYFGPSFVNRPLTSNSVVLRVQSSSFSSDAIVNATMYGSISGDAVVRTNRAGSITADALILRSTSSSLTSDADVRATISGSLSANSAIVRLMGGHFTGDAVVLMTRSGSVGADAVILRAASGSISASADIRSSRSGSLTFDATVSRVASGSIIADAVVKTTISGSLSANAVILRSLSGSFVTDAVTRRMSLGSISGDAVLRVAQSGSVSANAVVLAARSGSFTTNAFVPGTLTASAVILRATTGSFTSDAFVPGRLNANAAIRATILGSFSASAFVSGVGVNALAADAVIQKSTAGSFTSNAVTLRSISGSLSADAVLLAPRAGSTTAQAVLRATLSANLAASAVIFVRRSGSFTENAVVRAAESGSLTVDASIASPTAHAFTADAIILVARSGSLTADALIKRVTTSTFAGDAVLKKTISGSISANAVVFVTRSGSLTTNAVVRRTTTGSFTDDAVVKKVANGSLTANAVIFSTRSGSITANSVVGRAATGSISTDARIKIVVSAQFTTEAVVLRSQSGSIAATAVIQTAAGGTFTSAAVIRVSQSSSLSSDAYIMRVMSSSFTADANILNPNAIVAIKGKTYVDNTIDGRTFITDDVMTGTTYITDD